MCQAGSPILCVSQDHNVTSSGIITTQDGDGVMFWGALSAEHTEGPGVPAAEETEL